MSPDFPHSTDLPETGAESTKTRVDQLREQASQFAGDLKDRTQPLREQADRALQRGNEMVRENPLPLLLSALALGAAIGYVAGRQSQPTARERYFDEPLHGARDTLMALLAPVAASLRDQYGHVRSAAHHAADRVESFDPDPLAKHARSLGRRLKFW